MLSLLPLLEVEPGSLRCNDRYSPRRTLGREKGITYRHDLILSCGDVSPDKSPEVSSTTSSIFAFAASWL